MASTPRGAQAEAGLQASLPRDAPLFPSDKEGSLLRRHATRRPPQAQAQGVHGRQGRLFAQTRRREGSEAREPTQRERRDRRDRSEGAGGAPEGPPGGACSWHAPPGGPAYAGGE